MQTTSQTYRALLASGAPLQARATIGGVVYTDISAPVITRATMQDRLSVGNVVSASLALAVRGAVNIPRSAAVVVEVRLNDGQTASEWLPQGTFYISRRMRDPVTGLLALECYDALLKANAVWTPSAGAWPRTMAAVTAELAALLGVTLDSRTAIPTGAAYAMSEPAEGTTIRDALGVVAQAAGGNWVMTPAGLLRLVRVGESGDTVDVTGVVGGIDVGQAGTVTGVRSTVDGVVTLIGDDTGIVVDVSIAPMIAAEMAEDLIGQAYAPFHLSGAIYDPAAELGDGVRAGAGGEVISALCSEQAAYGPAFRGDIAAPDPGEVTDEYPYIGSAERTLALAKAAAIEAVDRLDDALTQQEIFNRLTDDGAAQGLLLYNGQLYINASYINAGYLSADHIQGGTLTLGGQGNQNGVLQVLDASGNVITVLNNAGADITNGSLTTYSTDRQTRTILSDGLLKFQFYNSAVQPIGWRDALRLAADPQSATIGTFAGIAELNISGRGRVKIKNKDSTTDPDYAEIDMDDDSISLTATKNLYGWTSLEVTKDGVTVTRYDHMGDPRVLFELAAGQSSKPLSIGNGGTGATTAAQARANLEITPANIGAVAKSGDTMTGNLSFAYANMLSYGEQTTRRWLLYPNEDLSSFLLATQELVNGEWANWRGVINAHTDGSIEINQPLGVDQGGTGTRDPAQARANLDVPSTTGSGASGTWGINVSGAANALAPAGFLNSYPGALSYYVSENFYGMSGWTHFIIANHGDAVNYFNYVLALPFWGKPQYKRQTGSQSAQSPWYEFLTTESPVLVTEGGTGATTPAVVISNEYTSVLNVINSIANTRVFPISVQKWGNSTYNDMPTGFESYEWNMVLTGDATRCTAFLYIYGSTGVFKRDYFAGSGGIWLTGWIKVSPITPGDIGAVAKSGDTMTGSLYVPNIIVRSGSWQIYFMQDSNGAEVGHVRGDGAAHHIAFREITPGTNSAYEDYFLPNPTNQSGAVGYSILTTKSAVGVPQGGTGATTPAQACANIGAMSLKSIPINRQTSSNANLQLIARSEGVPIVLTAQTNNGVRVYAAFGNYNDTYWGAKIFDNASNPVASTTIVGTLYYA